jgi:hypothetical protein
MSSNPATPARQIALEFDNSVAVGGTRFLSLILCPKHAQTYKPPFCYSVEPLAAGEPLDIPGCLLCASEKNPEMPLDHVAEQLSYTRVYRCRNPRHRNTEPQTEDLKNPGHLACGCMIRDAEFLHWQWA